MREHKKLKETIAFIIVAFVFCAPACAQQQGEKQRVAREDGQNRYRVAEPSDLSQENLSRVAASATQIRTVLVKNEGLLVELKRWVAKEATDNGQVVDDSDLTDQAILQRLEQDVAFRSVVTRLLQRYGYLVPTSNPDSDFAKEKELVLKERARRQVQIEAQEESRGRLPAAAADKPPAEGAHPRCDALTPDEPSKYARAITVAKPFANRTGGRIPASSGSAGWCEFTSGSRSDFSPGPAEH